MEPKEPIKEKISKFWNRPNPQNDLGILGAAAKGLFKGALSAMGVMGRQKATYDISLSGRYFCNQNKPDFGSVQRKNAEKRANNAREGKIKSSSKNAAEQVYTKLNEYIEKIKNNLNGFEILIDNNSDEQNIIILDIAYQGKKLAEYSIHIDAKVGQR